MSDAAIVRRPAGDDGTPDGNGGLPAAALLAALDAAAHAGGRAGHDGGR